MTNCHRMDITSPVFSYKAVSLSYEYKILNVKVTFAIKMNENGFFRRISLSVDTCDKPRKGMKIKSI